MNERIRQLLNEATVGLEPDLSPQRTVTLNEMEKFAELIVRECVGICNKIYHSNYPDAEEWERSEEGDVIKQHFGVEE